MSGKSKRRPIRPHERAKVDQFLAGARNLGASDPQTAVFVVEYADPGTPCCWCDCPVEEHQGRGADYVCDSLCPDDAVFIVHAMHGSPDQQSYPVCRRHNPDFQRFWLSMFHEETFAETHVYNAYDKDMYQ